MAADTVFGGGRGNVGACLTCKASEAYLTSNAKALSALFPGAAFFMRYDEMRHMHACESCTTRFKTSGELLAWHVGHATKILQSIANPPRIYAWQDMFDPYVNARDPYLQSGNLTGSWLGLKDTGIIMANWDHSNTLLGPHQKGVNDSMTKSIQFFGQQLHMPQLLCGYYGTGFGAEAARAQIQAAKGTPGILGMIYGPWAHNASLPGDPYLGGGDYSQLEEYASEAIKLWPPG